MSEDLKYPIGRVQFKPALTSNERADLIKAIAAAPVGLRTAVAGLNDQQLDTPYRPDGWTVRQVVHHVPDSHMNAFVRLKLALTEESPTIKPYKEALWANLPDARLPVEVSLRLTEALHERWVALMNTMADDLWSRTFVHPESGRVFTLDEMTQLYAWHGRHHVAHITELRKRSGW